MASVDELFGGGGGGFAGIDPAFMPFWDGSASLKATDSLTSYAPHQANFWTPLQNAGLTATATAGQWATICNVTGHGELFHVIAPLHAATTNTVDIEVTVDGGAYTFTNGRSLRANSVTGRVVLGACDGYEQRYTGASGPASHGFFFWRSEPQANMHVAAGDAWMIPSSMIQANGGPIIRFRQSLMVRTRVSALGTDTYAANTAAMYRVLGAPL